jgi:hypothetical protein
LSRCFVPTTCNYGHSETIKLNQAQKKQNKKIDNKKKRDKIRTSHTSKAVKEQQKSTAGPEQNRTNLVGREEMKPVANPLCVQVSHSLPDRLWTKPLASVHRLAKRVVMRKFESLLVLRGLVVTLCTRNVDGNDRKVVPVAPKDVQRVQRESET